MNEAAKNACEDAMNGNRTRASLLLRVKDLRDKKSWDEFVELYGPLILRYLQRKGVSRQEALDLLQDVLTIIIRNIGGFQYDPSGSFRAWLKKVASNRAKRFFTQQGRLPHLLAEADNTPDSNATQDKLIEKEWRKRCLEVAMKKVRPHVTEQTWRVFELRFVDGLSPAEIARQLGIKVGTVYTCLSRVLKKLREAVEKINE